MAAMSIPPLNIAAMTVDERLSLMDRLWESLQQDPEALQLSDAQEADLDRRLDEIDHGDSSGRSWDAIRDEYRTRNK
jgi:putative addiction module component (TIGR02574 family)